MDYTRFSIWVSVTSFTFLQATSITSFWLSLRTLELQFILWPCSHLIWPSLLDTLQSAATTASHESYTLVYTHWYHLVTLTRLVFFFFLYIFKYRKQRCETSSKLRPPLPGADRPLLRLQDMSHSNKSSRPTIFADQGFGRVNVNMDSKILQSPIFEVRCKSAKSAKITRLENLKLYDSLSVDTDMQAMSIKSVQHSMRYGVHERAQKVSKITHSQKWRRYGTSRII